MAQSRTEISKRYDDHASKRFSLKMHVVTDADIISKLQSVDSIQGYIKQLIRQDIEKDGSENA